MLQLSQSLLGQSVMSLRTGGGVATITSAIINPNNLKIEGFYVEDSFDKKKKLILLYQDIRDVIAHGVVVDDHDVLVEPEELVRLKDIIDLGFELIGKPVQSTSGEKLGKVSDYAVEISTMYIQKLYVSQSLVKSFSGGGLSVERNQITEISSRRIVIQDPLKPTKVMASAAVPA